MKSFKINQLKIGGILAYLNMFVAIIVSLIYTPIMIRLLGQSEYGLYNLVSSFVAYLAILNFGFGSSYLRYFSRYKSKNDTENIAKINGMFLIIFLVIAIVTIGIGLTLSNFTEIIFGNELTEVELDRAKILMIILSFNTGLSFIGIVFKSFVRVNERFLFQKSIELIKTVTSPFVILPILLLGFGSVGMALVTTVLNIVLEIVTIGYSKSKLKMQFSFKHFDKNLFFEMIIFSSFIFINMIVDQVNWQVDKFLIGRIQGTVAVSIYALASMIVIHFRQLSIIISGLFAPRIHKIASLGVNVKLEFTNLMIKVGRLKFLISGLFFGGFLFLGKPFIYWWVGDDFSDSYLIVVILTGITLLTIVQGTGVEFLKALNLHKFRAVTYLFVAVFNVIVSIYLINSYGPIGAAFGTLIAYVLGNVLIMNFYYHKKNVVNIVSFWRNILPLIVVLTTSILFTYIITSNFNTFEFFGFILTMLIFISIYSILNWIFTLSKYEKNLVIAPIKIVVKHVFK